MDISAVGRALIVVGVMIVVIGLVLIAGSRIPFLGRLPGDIVFQRDGLTVFIPLATMVVISVVLTLIVNVLSRLSR